MAEYNYGDTLIISTDNISFDGTMPEEADIDFGESYYQNTYTEMVSPSNPKDKYIDGSSRIIWSGVSPSSPEYDITEGRRAMWLSTVPGYSNKYYVKNDSMWITWQESGVSKTGNANVSFTLAWTGGVEANSIQIGNGSTSYPITQVFVESNIPIFETREEAYAYIIGESDGTNAINYNASPVSPDGQHFEIQVQWTTSTWTNDNQPQVTGQPYFQGVRGKITSGLLALYKIDGIQDGKLKYGIKNTATFFDLEYSTDGRTWTQTDEFPFDFIYRKRKNELGTFSYALSEWNTDIPRWSNEEDADDYINGNKPIEDSENWSEISSQYPTGNPTGTAEHHTQFGEVFTRNIFSQLYLCNTGGLYEISNALFDYDVTTLSGLWEDIKKGVEMYGSNPIEVVQGLRFYPVDLSQYFTSISPQQYIYFGAYKLEMQNAVQKVIYCNGYIDLGSLDIKRSFNDWRDFEPYTKLSIYLPYVGTFPLDVKKYYGKNVLIRYFIDLRTGACTACLIADGVLLDWFDGVIGTDMPITLTDYSSYAQSQLNIIMRNAGLGIAAEGVTGNVGVKSIKAAMTYTDNANAAQSKAIANASKTSLAAQTSAQYAGASIAGAAIGTGVAVGAVGVGTAMKTAFDMMRSGTAAHTKTKPASSAMINQYLPQYPYFRFEIMEIDESAYLNELYGRPSNASGIIANFSGYLEAEDVMLICPIATDNERQEIIDLVKSGIYI